MKNVKKFIASTLLCIFFSAFVFSQNPTKDFPYYYYDSTERTWQYYKNGFYGTQTTVDTNSNDFTMTIYKNNSEFFWVFRYKKDIPSEKKIKKTLSEYKDIVKKSDRTLDSSFGENMSICFIFLDANNKLICSAKYAN